MPDKEAMEEACDAALDNWLDNAPILVGREISLEERIRRASNAAVKQYLESCPQILELVNLVSLPEWNFHGDMTDWIDCVHAAVSGLGVPGSPMGLCPSCFEFRPDRTSEDGTWEQTFSTPCPHCHSEEIQ